MHALVMLARNCKYEGAQEQVLSCSGLHIVILTLMLEIV